MAFYSLTPKIIIMTTIAQKPAGKLNLWKTPILGAFVFWCWKLDAKRKLIWMQDHLKFLHSHIEIGSGPGSVLSVMRRNNYTVEGLDIADQAFSEDLRPTVYDGELMPFSNNDFNTALLLTVLHHTRDPDAILREAARIAKRIVIIEDVYDNRFMEWLTKCFDSLMNLEFFGHPHSNRSDAEWLETFERLGLRAVHKSIYRVGGIFKQAVYVLETE